MSNRFHNKFHRENHHSKRTLKNERITDAAYDPIASYEYPFQGEFYTNGEIVTDTFLSATSAFAGDLFVENNAVINNNLTVKNDAVIERNLDVLNDGFIHGDLVVAGSLSSLGTISQIDTVVFVTSAVSIENYGTGPALTVIQHGFEPIAHFIDANGDDIIFDDNGHVGLGTDTPSEKLDVVGNIRTSGTVNVQTLNTGSTNSVVTEQFGLLQKRLANPAIWNTTAKFVSASDGSLSTGFLTKAENVLGINESIVYDNGSRIGIGTTSPEAKLHVVGEIAAESITGEQAYIDGGTFTSNIEVGSLTPTSDTIYFWNRANSEYMNVVSKDATFTGATVAQTTVQANNIGTDEDNTVVILNSTGFLKTDEINPSVWDTTAKFISASHLPLTTNRIAKFGNSFGVRDSIIFDNGTNVGIGTTFMTEKLTVAGSISMTGSLFAAGSGIFGQKLAIGATSPRASLDIQKTDSMIIPVGPNTGRIALSGAIRYNTERGKFEGYDGAFWRDLDSDLTSIGLDQYLPLSGGTVSNLLCAEDFLVSTNFVSTSSTVLPVGDFTTRVSVIGSIRYNQILSAYEGFNGECWDTLGSVSDVDRDTYISSENAPCENNNQLKFFASNNEMMSIDLSSVKMAKTPSGVSTLYVLSSSKVGINTETPNEDLTVFGNISSSNKIFAENFIGKFSDLDGDTYISTENTRGANNNEIKLFVEGNNQAVVSLSAVKIFNIAHPSSTLFVASSTVGINTETPNKELTVQGSISASGDIYASNLYPIRRFDYIPGDPAISYTGITPFGNAESSNTWQITKIEYNLAGSILSITQAINVDWINRLTHTYA